MSSRKPASLQELDFIDTLDAKIILNYLEFLDDPRDWYYVIKTIKEILDLFNEAPTVEYAVGFDGVDDYVSIPDLAIGSKGIDLETSVWISQDNHGSQILSLMNSDDEVVLALKVSGGSYLPVKAFHRDNNGNLKESPISSIELEEWQELRIRSDGEFLSLEIDGDPVKLMDNIDLDNGPFKLNLGKGNNFHHFEGKVRNFWVSSGDNEVFSLQSGRDFSIKDKTGSAVTAGIWNTKK